MQIEKRWRIRHERWAKPTDRPLFDPRQYRVSTMMPCARGPPYGAKPYMPRPP